MPLKFNPFTGTLDYVSAIGEILKAKAPLKITGEEISLEEAEFVKKAPEQTIEGRKNFETPQPAEEAIAKASAVPIFVKSGKGGNSSNTVTALGGQSGRIEFVTGEGGQAPSATKENKGANSGSFTMKSGFGGEAFAAGAEKNLGGNSGEGIYTTGFGGLAKGGSISAKGGKSGKWTGGTGAGGEGVGATQTNEGGLAEGATLRTGAGGKGTGGEKAIGGNAGVLLLESGKGGFATGAASLTPGTGGPVRIVLGDGGGTGFGGEEEIKKEESRSGVFQVYYGRVEAARLRFEISATGLATCKKGLKVEETTTTEGMVYHRTAVADANYTVLVTDYIIGIVSLTKERFITLPAPNTIGTGQVFVIKDESGNAGKFTIRILGTIDGTVNPPLNRAFATFTIYNNGSSYSLIAESPPTLELTGPKEAEVTPQQKTPPPYAGPYTQIRQHGTEIRKSGE